MGDTGALHAGDDRLALGQRRCEGADDDAPRIGLEDESSVVDVDRGAQA